MKNGVCVSFSQISSMKFSNCEFCIYVHTRMDYLCLAGNEVITSMIVYIVHVVMPTDLSMCGVEKENASPPIGHQFA